VSTVHSCKSVLKPLFRSPNADSDTGDMDKSAKKKVKRKKTGQQGPCMRVISVTKDTDNEEEGEKEGGGGGYKVECHLDTIQQKTVTFEFLTSDLSTDEMSAAFVSDSAF